MKESLHFDGLFILSYGGPNGPEEVGPFFDRILLGRPIPLARRRKMEEKYAPFEGKSPIIEQGAELITHLTEELKEAGYADGSVQIGFGNLYAEPLIEETVESFYKENRRSVLVIIANPFDSPQTCRRYLDALTRGVGKVEKKLGIGPDSPNRIEFSFVPPWRDEPAYQKALADSLLELLAADLLQYGVWPADASTGVEEAEILFTAHSIPLPDATRSGYDRQILGVCRSIAERTGLGQRFSEISPNSNGNGTNGSRMVWELVWQSRSGWPGELWLGPDILEYVAARKSRISDFSRILVVPIGFLLENMETVSDLDRELAQNCSDLGISYRRAQTVGTKPEIARMFVSFLSRPPEKFQKIQLRY